MIPHLLHAIEPVRFGKKLHLTRIRNENAYYCCIAQLLSIPGMIEKNVISKDRHIYVIGDSHTLATAWREIEAGDSSYLLCPRVVTGLKHCTHLSGV